MAAENEAVPAGENTVVRDTERVTGSESENYDSGSDIASNLRSAGGDTDRISEAAREPVSELQRLLIEEVRAQPLRALAWAATAGVIVGVWAAR